MKRRHFLRNLTIKLTALSLDSWLMICWDFRNSSRLSDIVLVSSASVPLQVNFLDSIFLLYSFSFSSSILSWRNSANSTLFLASCILSSISIVSDLFRSNSVRSRFCSWMKILLSDTVSIQAQQTSLQSHSSATNAGVRTQYYVMNDTRTLYQKNSMVIRHRSTKTGTWAIMNMWGHTKCS